MKKIYFQKDPINIAEIIAAVGTESDGSVVTFIGRARNRSQEKEVKYLDYDIYNEMARKEMDKIVDDAMEKWSLNDCFVSHRYGRIEIGEASIVIAVSSPHREESFAASRYIIDTIKKRVPIWKREIYQDGSQWITDTA